MKGITSMVRQAAGGREVTRPLPLTKPRCPDCRKPLTLDRGVWECLRCRVGWTPAAIQGAARG